MKEISWRVKYGAEDNLIDVIHTPLGGLKMASLKCRDLGMDCSFKTEGLTAEEIMRQFFDHSESAHKMSVLSSDLIFRVQKAMKK